MSAFLCALSLLYYVCVVRAELHTSNNEVSLLHAFIPWHPNGSAYTSAVGSTYLHVCCEHECMQVRNQQDGVLLELPFLHVTEFGVWICAVPLISIPFAYLISTATAHVVLRLRAKHKIQNMVHQELVPGRFTPAITIGDGIEPHTSIVDSYFESCWWLVLLSTTCIAFAVSPHKSVFSFMWALASTFHSSRRAFYKSLNVLLKRQYEMCVNAAHVAYLLQQELAKKDT